MIMNQYNKYNILVIPSWYPTFKGDPGGSFFRDQALQFVSRGHSVKILVIQFLPLVSFLVRREKKLYVRYVDHGIKTYKITIPNVFPMLPILKLKAFVFTGMYLFKKMYGGKKRQPHIIFAQSCLNAGVLANIINKKFGTPFIIQEHSSIFVRDLASPLEVKEAAIAFGNASELIAVSNYLALSLKKAFPSVKRTWKVVPNMVGQQFLDAKITNWKKNFFQFVTVCSLDENKGVEDLIRAFANSFKSNCNYKLLIVGRGSLYQKLRELACELSIIDQVDFTGEVTREEVLENIMKSDALVVSSKVETFGIVVIEALALGVPVVSTRCGGPLDTINNMNGVLVDVSSVESIGQGLIYMSANRSKYDPVVLREFCAEKFSCKTVMSQLEKSIIKVVKNKAVIPPENNT